jgi:methyltransferase (TIGR00027 family)
MKEEPIICQIRFTLPQNPVLPGKLMKQDYSRTAEGMAMVRALEQAKPISQRIIADPYAREFLINRIFRLIAGSPWLSRLMTSFLDYWAPGGQEFLTARPRLVDDLASKLALQGLEQIVILGAGFDTMALRIKNYLPGVTLFEVDHPATQTVKQRVTQKIGVQVNVHYVAVDFERDDFFAKLREAGFDPARKSFIIWVGVSYYLSEQAVARTLEQISTLSESGTHLVFDYMLAEVIDGSTTNREALEKARRVSQLGEPWIFGLKIDEVANYLARFGFRLIRDYEPEELQALYCPQRQVPMSYVRIAVCERI